MESVDTYAYTRIARRAREGASDAPRSVPLMNIPERSTTVRSGLSVLLGGAPDTPEVSSTGTLVELSIDSIVRNESQPRTQFDAGAIAALAESIESKGLIQPIAVRRLDHHRYEIVAGERRWLAAQRAGLRKLPAIVHDVDERESLILALVENVVRQDLNPLETARAYAALQDTWEVSTAELARAMGKSRPAVANTMRLLELPDDVLAALDARKLSEGHGRALLGLPDRADQRRFARSAIQSGMSVRSLEQAVRTHLDRDPASPLANRSKWNTQPDHELQERIDGIANLLPEGVNIRIKTAKSGAKLELHCTSTPALDSLLSSLEHAFAVR